MHHNLSQLEFHGPQNFTNQNNLNPYNSSCQIPKETLQKVHCGKKTARRDNTSNIYGSRQKLTIHPCLKHDLKNNELMLNKNPNYQLLKKKLSYLKPTWLVSQKHIFSKIIIK